MNSSIQSILLKEKQIEKEIKKYQLSIESKIDKLRVKKSQEKKDLILTLEKKNSTEIQKLENDIQKKYEVLINDAKESSKKISYNSYLDSLILKINDEFNLNPAVSKVRGSKK
ncbi:MAG: hypothetical protein ACMXYB_05210 [Candidatus Woesearchaeota archaeon]